MKSQANTRNTSKSKPASAVTNYPLPNKADLLHILRTPRRHGTKSELDFREGLVTKLATTPESIAPEGVVTLRHHTKGVLGYAVVVPHVDGQFSTTLFSSHIDTVDDSKHTAPHVIEEHNNTLHTDGTSILGADCGAGVWLMLQMIDYAIPGTYVFTVGEEVGGIGAAGLAEEDWEFLHRHDRAVAFDRGRTNSVITHQAGGRCCSDTFAQALSDELNKHNDELMFSPDDSGVYTDTAEWTHIIPECTNISIGYDHQHTYAESLDLAHLDRLMDAAMLVDWDALPCDRDPNKVDVDNRWSDWTSRAPRGWDKIEADDHYEPLNLDTLANKDWEDIYELVLDRPEAVATLLFELGN